MLERGRRRLSRPVDPLLSRKRPIRVVSCSNESMSIIKFILTRTPIPPTPLLSQVPRNSSPPVSKVALSGRCLLVSVSPMASYMTFLACIIKFPMQASNARVQAAPTEILTREKSNVACEWELQLR
ncbi:hypothetical protein ANCDUO_26646 [Ancylostoma duodenale]|uniref:Uncharacterized protein n=1 Tax=Ancylostoma duodenale TaxID=51022 RepID=A0A0C2FEB6_9BILA|nr:hypothetical protein ANCDUO_26646 [Ancylostoma duodenale]